MQGKGVIAMLPRRKTLTERLAEMRKMREQPQEAVRIPTAMVNEGIKKGVFDIRIPEVAPQQVKNYKVVTTEQELIDYLKRCEETGLCGFDYETTISEQYRKMVNDKRTNIEYLYSEKLLTDKELKSELKALNNDFLKAPLDPHKADICTVSLSAAPHEAIVVFIGNKGENQYKAKNPAESLKEVFYILDKHLFINPKIIKIAVNLSFETKHTLKQGKYILNPVADPLVMWVRCSQIVFPENILNPKNPLAGKGLKPMTKEVFGVEMQDFSALLEKHGVQFFSEISADHPDAVSYSAEDSDYAVQHYLYWREIAKQIDRYDEWLHEIEMPFTRVIGTMEYWGMPWDNEVAQAKLIEAEAKKEKAITEIEDIARSYGVETKLLKSANVNSIKHLVYNVLKAPVPRLSDKGNLSLNEENLIDLKFMLENKLESLKEEDLLVVDESYSSQKQAQKAVIMAREEHPNKSILLRLIELLKDAQKMTTLISSHIIGRQNWLHPVTGRIHAKYHQWTETGRLGSREPKPYWAIYA